MKLSELMERLGGTVAQGSPDHRLRGVNSSGRATSADIVFAEDASSASEALASKAGVIILRPGLVTSYPAGKCVVETPQPRLWFARAGKLLKPALPIGGVHAAAVLGANVNLGEDVTIGPCAVIEDNARIGARTRIEAGAIIGSGVRVGDYCRIYPRAVLYPGTTLGNWVVVHAGAVLGGDGFGYVRNPSTGAYTQFPQQGTLVIEDEVEIGANTTIDRGALGETRLHRGVKIDNLVHVGHNCDIGEDVILVALTGISGSSSVGKGAVLAGQVGIGDHVHVGPGVILGGQSGVFNGKSVNTEPGTVLYGTPARPLKQVLREQAILSRLAKSRSRKNGSGNSADD
jgi:UDP-3-O-[3-hydroxymyristoyl] glucosamine N-acyltransferase